MSLRFCLHSSLLQLHSREIFETEDPPEHHNEQGYFVNDHLFGEGNVHICSGGRRWAFLSDKLSTQVRVISDDAVDVLSDTPLHSAFRIHRPHEHFLSHLFRVFEEAASQRAHQDLLVNIVRNEVGKREESACGTEIKADERHGIFRKMFLDMRDE